MKALYRKYRPTKLSEVLGQEQVVKPLENAIKSGKISHAYLFTGPRGCGKTSVARIFAHEINHFPYKIEDSYVDIIEIDAASNTGVDNIRELREKAVVAPSQGRYKVYIIDEVHMLSKAAFNALLKTLEEPPESVIFIMATTDAYKVPITITSRSQVFNFQLAQPDTMLKHLQNIAQSEKIDIDPEALSQIVQRGGGSFRDSISLLDQVSNVKSGKISAKDVISALGLPDDDVIASLLDAYKQGKITEISDLLQQELNSGTKAEILAENLINTIIKQPEPKLLPLLERLPSVSGQFADAKILLAFLAEAAEMPKFQLSPPKSAETAVSNKKPLESLSAAPTPVSAFDWQDYLEAIKSKNIAVGAILEKCAHEITGDKLYLYVERRNHLMILDSTSNRAFLEAELPQGFSLEIEESQKRTGKNAKLHKISDIMGEVTEVNVDGVPFK